MRNKRPHHNVAAGVIWKQGMILITRRPEGRHLAGLWEFPGGKQEDGESLEACLEREIREELGLRISVDRAIMRVEYSYDHKDISLHVFYCSIIEGIPRGMECQDIRWIDPSNLQKFNFPPPDMKVVEFISTNDNGKY